MRYTIYGRPFLKARERSLVPKSEMSLILAESRAGNMEADEALMQRLDELEAAEDAATARSAAPSIINAKDSTFIPRQNQKKQMAGQAGMVLIDRVLRQKYPQARGKAGRQTR